MGDKGKVRAEKRSSEKVKGESNERGFEEREGWVRGEEGGRKM